MQQDQTIVQKRLWLLKYVHGNTNRKGAHPKRMQENSTVSEYSELFMRLALKAINGSTFLRLLRSRLHEGR